MRFRDLGFNVWADVRYAFRTLKGAPGYAATLMLTLCWVLERLRRC